MRVCHRRDKYIPDPKRDTRDRGEESEESEEANYAGIHDYAEAMVETMGQPLGDVYLFGCLPQMHGHRFIPLSLC
jgi:hypothetical protein